MDNGTEYDAVIRLVNRRTGQAERVVFIGAHEKATVRGIATGTFILKYGLGWGLTHRWAFERYGHYGQFDDTFVFTETADWVSTWSVTLYTVAGGNATTTDISEADFLGSDPAQPAAQRDEGAVVSRTGVEHVVARLAPGCGNGSGCTAPEPLVLPPQARRRGKRSGYPFVMPGYLADMAQAAGPARG